MSHFDRERIPERVVHARGFVAHGTFEAYGKVGDEPISKYTRAKLVQEKGKKTPVSVRFSTVIGGRDSSESARDPRGFAVNYLQLPVNRSIEDIKVATNLDGGTMSYRLNEHGADPAVNYGPSLRAGLQEADDFYKQYRPYVEGHLVEMPIERTNNYAQAGALYRRVLSPRDKEDLRPPGREGIGVDLASLDIEGLLASVAPRQR